MKAHSKGVKNGGWAASKRNSKRLTPSQGVITSMLQVSHLDGLSEKHFHDVRDTHRHLCPDQVKLDLAEEALFESYYKGTGPRPELVTNLWFGDCGADHIAPDGHDGSAVVMPGARWQDLIERADTSRREWRDAAGKKRQTAADREMSGTLRKIFARLTPWLAVEAGKEIRRDQLVGAVSELVAEFQKETGHRVIAANVHAESGHDIHVHLIYTALVPVVSEQNKYSPDYLAKLLTKQRARVRTTLLEGRGTRPTLKEVNEELERLWNSGALDNPKGHRAYYQRLQRPENARRYLKSMGQPYCSKTALWEADNRSRRVAGINEQQGHHFTFDAVVVEGAKRAESATARSAGPEDIYIDYWLAKRWNKAIGRHLTPEAFRRAQESAKEHVERYLRDGSSLPNPVLESARIRVAKEIEARLGALDAREDNLAAREAAYADAVQQFATKMAELRTRASELEKAKNDIEKAKAALRRIPVPELCARLGFASNSEGNLVLEISNTYGPLPHRLLHKGQAFRLEFYNLGAQRWEHVGSGNGAIDLIRLLPPKPTLSAACEKLIALFPDCSGGLTLEALEYKARQNRKEMVPDQNLQRPPQDPLI